MRGGWSRELSARQEKLKDCYLALVVIIEYLFDHVKTGGRSKTEKEEEKILMFFLYPIEMASLPISGGATQE